VGKFLRELFKNLFQRIVSAPRLVFRSLDRVYYTHKEREILKNC
jgi:hypothetical protein